MSYFELYDFRAIDRPLTAAERKTISGWSSRTEASSHRAVFTYSHSSLGYDEHKAMLRYFDFLGWIDTGGGRRIAFRFPKDQIDLEAIRSFFSENYYYFNKDYVVVDISINNDELAYGWIEDDADFFSDILPLRKAILRGDYRCLYLLWLHLCDVEYGFDSDEEDDIPTPPIPPNLSELDESLQALVRFFEIDELLIKAAAEQSPRLSIANEEEADEATIRARIAALPDAVKNDLLYALYRDEESVAGALCRKTVSPPVRANVVGGGFSGAGASPAPIFQRREVLRREKAAADAAAKERERLKRIEITQATEAEHWSSVLWNIEQRKPKHYDAAVELLKLLKELYEHWGTLDEWRARVEAILQKFPSLSGLKQRVKGVM